MEDVYVLPGVPQIFVRQFDRIAEGFRGRERELVVIYVIVGEGRIAEPLTAATEIFSSTAFGSYPIMGKSEYRTRITLESEDANELDEAVVWLCERFREQVARVERNARRLQ
jgi:molybdopterin-biosynthesis enzyme MoeA-like protein